MTRTVLLLAGTAEARDLAGRFRGEGLRLVASLAGVTTAPLAYFCETRVGGFGGPDAMAEWLRAENVVAVVDATHPFAERISANAAIATETAQVPLLALRRTPWILPERSREFSSIETVAEAIPSRARVFLTTGRGDLAVFAARKDVRILLRSIEPVEGLPVHIDTLLARPPFSFEDEIAVMRDHRITHLITKNAGGEPPAKLAAAEALEIELFSIEMPGSPDGIESADTVADALEWVDRVTRC